MMGLFEGRNSHEFFEMRDWKYIAAFYNSSMADNAKLKKVFGDVLGDHPFKRKLSIASVELNAGQVILFDESLTMEERVDAIISSSAVPFAFPFEIIDGQALVDGSLFSTISIGDPIARCREEVENDSDIIVDVIMCYADVYSVQEMTLDETRWMTAYDFYDRRREIFHQYYYKEDLFLQQRSFKNINFRLYVEPSEALTQDGAVPIYATAEDLRREIDLGIKDGKRAVEELQAKIYQESLLPTQ